MYHKIRHNHKIIHALFFFSLPVLVSRYHRWEWFFRNGITFQQAPMQELHLSLDLTWILSRVMQGYLSATLEHYSRDKNKEHIPKKHPNSPRWSDYHGSCQHCTFIWNRNKFQGSEFHLPSHHGQAEIADMPSSGSSNQEHRSGTCSSYFNRKGALAYYISSPLRRHLKQGSAKWKVGLSSIISKYIVNMLSFAWVVQGLGKW